MKSIILLITLLNFSFSFGQMLSNEKANILSEEPFFNIHFINSVKLKALKGTVSTKQELGTIKSAGKHQNYLFNSTGQLSCYYTTKAKNRKRDTNFIFYNYGSKGNLVVKRYSDSYGFYSYSYKYNEQGLKINQIYSREKNASKSKINFSLKEQYVVFEESYKYSNKDSILSKITLNSNGRPYQKQQIYYNSLGYMTEIRSRLLINNKFSRETYAYNDKGFLKSVEYYRDNNESPYKAVKYDYDEWGNVTFVDEYKDQKRIIHKELLYNPSTFILKTILSQDLVTNLITITKFKPQFYN
jgi:hypothetical protein